MLWSARNAPDAIQARSAGIHPPFRPEAAGSKVARTALHLPGGDPMSVDVFLKLEGYDGKLVKGEAQDASHKEEIEVSFWSWAMTQTLDIGSHSGGAGAGKVTFDRCQIHKPVDCASPLLYDYACSGTPFKTATLTARKAGGNPLDYFVVTMKLAAVAKLQWSGPDPETELLTETLMLEFGGAQIKYVTQGSDGKKLKEIELGWDRVRNMRI